MKVRQTGAALAGILILIAVQPACHKESREEILKENILAGNPNRVVTISKSDTNVSNPCEVDFPVVFLRTNKNHTIAWGAADHDFWVVFPTGSPVGTNSFKILEGKEAGPFKITPTSPTGYFMYAIYDSDPNSIPAPTPCKLATEDHDTGVNIKR